MNCVNCTHNVSDICLIHKAVIVACRPVMMVYNLKGNTFELMEECEEYERI